MDRPFVDAAHPPDLEPIFAGLRHAVRGAGRRGSVLPNPPASDSGASSAGRVAAATSGVELLPEEGVPAEALYEDLAGLAEGAALVARPGWLGHMDPAPTWASVLGAAVAALLNNNLLMEEMSPSFTRLEEGVTRGLAREVGLGPEASGTFTAGGSLANLLALAVARDEALQQRASSGMERQAALSRLTVVASEDAHVSQRTSANLLGLDPERGMLRVEPAAGGRLDPVDVERAIAEAEAAGRVCFCLVATAGTTVLGAVDPLEALADVASDLGLWYHVDAAYGGALAFSRRRASLLEGIERADSVTLNPQKWLYVAKVCALALFADRGRWQRAMDGRIPYAAPGDGAPSRSALQVEGTRPADVLKLWLSLRQMGRRGIEDVVERALGLTERFAAEVLRRPYLSLAAEPQTNIVVFRCAGDDGGDGRDRTAALHDRLLEEADVFLSLPEYRGRRWLRAVLLNPFAGDETIDRAFSAVDAFHEERGVE